MKTARISILTLITGLIMAGQFVWAAAPGSGVTGEKKDRKMEERQQQLPSAAQAPVSDMERMAVEEAELVKPATPSPTAKSTVNKVVPQKKRVGNGAEPAIDHAETAKLNAREKRRKRRAAFQKVRALGKANRAARNKKHAPTAPDAGGNPAIFIVLAFFIPPLSVFLWMGDATTEFWLNILLTLLFWVPGIIHAIIVILR